MYLILPTKYGSIEESRFKLFLNTIKIILNHHYIKKVIIVDSSHEKVYNNLKILLKNERIVLLNQKEKKFLKGGSLREGIKYIIDNLPKGIISFQEPEKSNMIFHYPIIIEKYGAVKDFICIPNRTSTSFQTYPREQYYSENFINAYISKLVGVECDISFGPVMFTTDMAKYWLEYDGKLWDAQIIPIYRAIQDNIKILTHKVSFSYPINQKKKEEGNLEFIEKRRYQLNYMVDAILKEFNSK